VKRKLLLVAVLAIATTAVLAVPALAKGPGENEVRGYALITGPGLRVPVAITGAVPARDTQILADGQTSAFARLLLETGLAPAQGAGAAWYPSPTARSSLGPKFEIQWYLRGDAEDGPVETVVQELYPYAPGHPWVFTASGQTLMGQSAPSAWWSAPRSLSMTLAPYGMGVTARNAGSAASVPATHGGLSVVWILVVAGAALALLTIGGAVTGRVRAARSAA
jgi:hypothetical protein